MNLVQLNLELSNRCQLRCKYCCFHPSRKPWMNPELLGKLLTELEDSDVKVELLSLSHGGESLLNPDFNIFVLLLENFQHLFKDVSVTTNGLLLTEKQVDFLVENPYLTRIIVSIDGYNKESYNKIRPDSDYDLVLKNLKYLIDHYPKDRIEVANGVDETDYRGDGNYNIDKQLFSLMDNIKVNEYRFHGWLNKPVKTSVCPYDNRTLAILTTGMVTKCCYDINGVFEFANFNSDSLTNIFLKQRPRCMECINPSCV